MTFREAFFLKMISSMLIFFAVVPSLSLLSVHEVSADEHVVVEVPPAASGFYSVPDPSDIKSIEAEMQNVSHPLPQPDIERFRVPKEHYEKILSFFQKPTVDREPGVRWPEFGSIKITRTGGGVLTIPCYSRYSNSGSLMYSIRGVRCIDGGGNDSLDGYRLYLIVREAYKDATGNYPAKQQGEDRD